MNCSGFKKTVYLELDCLESYQRHITSQAGVDPLTADACLLVAVHMPATMIQGHPYHLEFAEYTDTAKMRWWKWSKTPCDFTACSRGTGGHVDFIVPTTPAGPLKSGQVPVAVGETWYLSLCNHDPAGPAKDGTDSRNMLIDLGPG